MNGIINIGIDVGNYDTKTPHSSTATGYSVSDKSTFGKEKELIFNGKHYIPNTKRFPYTKDKTVNERCFILSLFAISKELIALAEEYIKNYSFLKTPELLQKEISSVCEINLGVGLPPTHIKMLADKTKSYYEVYLKNGVSYEYAGYRFFYRLNKIAVYPQDYAAIVTNTNSTIIHGYESFYGIDIGGYTADGIAFESGQVNYDLCDSKPLGILKMYDAICAEVEGQTGTRVTPNIIESVLMEKPTVLKPEEINIIHILAENWANNIIGEFIQYGYEFNAYPAIFLGGGSGLLKNYIKRALPNNVIEFYTDSRANAIGYTNLIARM